MLDNIGSIEEFNTQIKQDITQRGFVFVDYSQIDSNLAPKDKSVGAICMTDFIEDWQDLDRVSYKEKKQKLIETTLQKLEKHYPNISELVEYH